MEMILLNPMFLSTTPTHRNGSSKTELETIKIMVGKWKEEES